ncbi:bifunctional phosphopantothenoylcysteine decarboxylase/phosphopantothenate--cysteine ligase CoaBC [Fructilactobacillus ixorae]|uniref:Coenzyme A biosynthesis bifunctional protein CoaBC n=1 Tax=Fructilactobacillus ixorae TaxID=1750535 RepID=A0ABY5C524_9LACO|nr:bifunctional phosphopantothenoylcysteine decarboxylase/phosphopantothenate--cysteine ligase CoaBC [Fructilactobacillus ixorae]USS93875.1 bifunctional phosphopantothenoylcysteine decarboxylase/phosphopantothenate--cysteine ligase CoaBC [Fructilactobacillus ixorae]
MNGEKITLYVTGSIAAYKAVSLLRLCQKAGADVRVVMTAAATRFVTPQTFAALSGHSVLTDAATHQETIAHVELAQWGTCHVVAPASADFIAKAAVGIADSVALTTYLAARGPKLVVPAMNDGMWDNPATRRNITQLRQDGQQVLEPVIGLLAEGYAAKGRMADPEVIMTALQQLQGKPQDWAGKHLLVTAGGTQEDLDPVRYLSNRSSGKMGYALANAASQRGAQVTLLSANVNLPIPTGVKVIPVRTAADLKDQLQQLFPTMDGLLMAAAVSDFRPVQVAEHKLKKTAAGEEMTLRFQQNPDLLKLVAAHKRPDQVVVGFAAETHDWRQNALHKLAAKQADYIVLNDVSNPAIGFNSDDNQVTIFGADGFQEQTPIETKAAIADHILTVINPKDR